jgi:hypothetical protein
METGLRQAKSTGYSPSTKTDSESDLAPVESTAKQKGSPVSTAVHLKDEYSTSDAEAFLSKLLAIQIMLGDFKALKNELPASRQSSANGKIYWSAELPGHVLAVENGKLLVDGTPVEMYLEKLLAEEK